MGRPEMDRPEAVVESTVIRCGSWRQVECVVGSWREEGRAGWSAEEMRKLRVLHLMGVTVRLWQRVTRPVPPQAGARGTRRRELVELIIEPEGGRRG